jgi:hypothetical protein
MRSIPFNGELFTFSKDSAADFAAECEQIRRSDELSPEVMAKLFTASHMIEQGAMSYDDAVRRREHILSQTRRPKPGIGWIHIVVVGLLLWAGYALSRETPPVHAVPLYDTAAPVSAPAPEVSR